MHEFLGRSGRHFRRLAGSLAGGVEGLAQQLWVGAACAALALAGRWAIDPWLGDRHQFLPGYLAVVAAAWLASWRGGAIAAALFLAANTGLFAARSPADASLLHEVLAHVSFLAVAGVLLGVTEVAVCTYRGMQDRVRRLAEADHRKSDFMAMVAHELRNPLSMLSAGTEMIRQGKLDPHALDDVWQALERQTAHMKRLVGDLMDAARAEQGKLALIKETVEVAAVVAPAVADAQTFADSRRQRISVTMPQDAGRLEVDAHRMEQVLGNLLHNACKFSPEGAVIETRVEASPTEVSFVVADPGVGIEPSQLHAIFESFVQLEPGARRGNGLGLGLALCRKLVAMHGGSIEASSEGPGRGSQFRVRLPRAPELAGPAIARPEAPAPAQVAAPRAPKVMVVDDNVDCADSLATLLRLDGYQALVAYDGRSALAAATAEAPSVVFIDMCLPDMTGRELATGIGQALGPRRPALIALSGMDADEGGSPPGFFSYLVKPVGMEEIRHVLAALPREPARLH